MTTHDAVVALLGAFVLVAARASAQATFAEVEPNTTKAQADANGAFVMASGDMLTGTSTGSVISPANSAMNTVDLFRVKTAPAALGIYRHAVTLDAAPSGTHQGTLRGLTHFGGTVTPGTDSLVQVSTNGGTTPRTNVWYGFGKAEEIYYRVNGQSATTSPYVATLSTTPVIPVDAGSHVEGEISFSTTAATNTEIWIYDANFDVVSGFGNDNPSIGVAPAVLTRTFAPGLYHLAICRSNLANDQPDPPDSSGSGHVLDFPDAAACGNSIVVSDLSFSIADCDGETLVAASTSVIYEILWYAFTVTPNFKLVLSQPSGASSIVLSNSNGVPGRLYVNAITLNQGLFPAGWFYGIDVPYAELAGEISLGVPFIGMLDAFGGASFTVPGPVPSGLTVYGVGIELDPLTLLPVTSCGSPFSYTTQ